MEFRSPVIAAQENARALAYLTRNLSTPESGKRLVNELLEELGNAVENFPDWHPIITLPVGGRTFHHHEAYPGSDHTVRFVRGFITCPYSEEAANQLVAIVAKIPGLSARRLWEPLYSDHAYPVVVIAEGVALESDGTIRSRDAITLFTQQTAATADAAQIAETWWNVRSHILGSPHGSRSSLFVNQHAGLHMRRILEAMNASGMFGPIKEYSLDMLSPRKRNAISANLLQAAIREWDKKSPSHTFELRGEHCKARVRDTWSDGTELSVTVEIGHYDLVVSGHYNVKDGKISHIEPVGRRQLAEKFA